MAIDREHLPATPGEILDALGVIVDPLAPEQLPVPSSFTNAGLDVTAAKEAAEAARDLYFADREKRLSSYEPQFDPTTYAVREFYPEAKAAGIKGLLNRPLSLVVVDYSYPEYDQQYNRTVIKSEQMVQIGSMIDGDEPSFNSDVRLGFSPDVFDHLEDYGGVIRPQGYIEPRYFRRTADSYPKPENVVLGALIGRDFSKASFEARAMRQGVWVPINRLNEMPGDKTVLTRLQQSLQAQAGKRAA